MNFIFKWILASPIAISLVGLSTGGFITAFGFGVIAWILVDLEVDSWSRERERLGLELKLESLEFKLEQIHQSVMSSINTPE